MKLSTQAVDSFWTELEKIAVSTVELLEKVRKARGVRIGKHTETVMGGGGVAMPADPKIQKMLIDKRSAPVSKAVEKAEELVEKKVPKKWKKPAQTAVQGAKEGVERFKRMSLEAGKAQRGKITVDPEIAGAVMGARTKGGAPKRMAERGALGASVTAHELFERGVKRKNVAPLYSHIAPEVLLKEHNLLSRLTGPGAEYAKKTMRKQRAASGEAKHMKGLLTTAFKDPRAAQFLREGEKVPKAMRKALRRRLKEEPDLIKRTKPKKSALQVVKDLPSSVATQVRGGKGVNKIVKERTQPVVSDKPSAADASRVTAKKLTEQMAARSRAQAKKRKFTPEDAKHLSRMVRQKKGA